MMRRPVLITLSGAALLCALPALAQTPPAAAPAATPAPLPPYAAAPVDLALAKKLVAAAEAEARRNGWTMAFAVVEPSGALVAFEKMDGTQYGSIEVAQAKARTAARFRRPSKAFADQVADGRLGVMSLDGVVAIEGGVPIVVDGKIVGAIGVSGGSSAQDGQVAQAAIAAALAK